MTDRKRINLKILAVMHELINEGVIKNKAEFAKRLNITSSVISEISSEGRNFSIEMIINFFKHFGRYLEPNELFVFDKIDEFDDNISFVTNANAGTSLSIKDKDVDFNFKIPDLERKHYAFRVKGDSMYPTLTNGDILICMKINNRDIKSGEIYVVDTNEGINVKRVFITLENGKPISIELKSDNSIGNPPIKPDLSRGLHGSPFFQTYCPVRRIIKM